MHNMFKLNIVCLPLSQSNLKEISSNDKPTLLFQFYTALMKEITEVHGDYGNGAVRNSILIKVADTDICLIRIESTAEM